MNVLINVLLGACAQGLLWAIMAIGVYITYRILDIADLTAEGSFTLGAAVTCQLIVSGMNPFLATLIATIAGILAGLVTGILHTKFKIPALLSGILTMTALWSINLRIMKKPNISLLNNTTVLSIIEKTSLTQNIAAFLSNQTNTIISAKTISAIIAGFIFTLIVIFILWWFFNTEIGYAVRATGNNKNMIRALGVNTNIMIILGIVIGNALIALSGSLVAQYNRFSDISMGTGTIVIGLASVIIGEVIFNDKSSFKVFISVALGSVIYRIIIAVTLQLGLYPDDLKMISSCLIVIALCLPNFRNNILSPIKNSFKKGGTQNADAK